MIKKQLSTKEFIWMAIIFWAASFTAMEAPFSFVFNTKVHHWQVVVDLIISTLFVIDLRHNIIDRKKARKIELGHHSVWKSRLLLMVDVLALIPFDAISFFIGNSHIIQALRLFRLVRIIKVFAVIQNISVVPILFRIQSYGILFLTVVTWIACGWILIYPANNAYDTTTYFIRSCYWAITTLTTIGYGDITPTDNIGMIFTSCIMIIGVGMYGIVIGNITRMMSLADRYREQSREKMNDLMQFMKHYRIPENLQEAVINHYNHIYSKRLSHNDNQIIAELPYALQHEMQVYMKIKLISSIPIFKNCSHLCLKDVATNLEQIYSSPGDLVIKIGDIGEEMFIIAHGTVDISINSDEIIASLHDGQIFGEVALLKEIKRTANVRSKSYCDFYKLTSQSFREIVKKHPILLNNIEQIIQKRTGNKK